MATNKPFRVIKVKKKEPRTTPESALKKQEIKYAEDAEARRTTPYVLGRWPQTNKELWLFVKATWGIEIPYKKVCPDHVAPFQAFADAYFARYPVAIWKASRGLGGKTHLLSLLGSTEMLTLGCFVTILGGSGEQSMRVHESMQTFWEYSGAPGYMVEKMTRFESYLSNGAKARTLMASQKSVRGPHPQRLRLDEIDEMDWDIFTSAQGQPMRSKRLPNVETQTVASSTHQYPDATMTKAIQVANDRGWPVYSWCYRETSAPGGWLTMEEVERKRSEISKQMWDNEYELQDPSFEGRAIDQDAVSAMFDPALGTYPGHPTKYYEFEVPREDRDYITGVDWAKSQDMTVCWTWDTTTLPWRAVAFQRFNRMPWPVIVKLVNMRLARWGGKLIHDSTGLGSVVKDYLVLPEGMSNRDVKHQTIGGRERTEMLNAYVSAIEAGNFKTPRILWAYNEHRFATQEHLFGRLHLPDSICAGALAWHMRRGGLRKEQVTAPDMSETLVKAGGSPWKVM